MQDAAVNTDPGHVIQLDVCTRCMLPRPTTRTGIAGGGKHIRASERGHREVAALRAGAFVVFRALFALVTRFVDRFVVFFAALRGRGAAVGSSTVSSVQKSCANCGLVTYA